MTGRGGIRYDRVVGEREGALCAWLAEKDDEESGPGVITDFVLSLAFNSLDAIERHSGLSGVMPCWQWHTLDWIPPPSLGFGSMIGICRYATRLLKSQGDTEECTGACRIPSPIAAGKTCRASRSP